MINEGKGISDKNFNNLNNSDDLCNPTKTSPF